MIYISLALLLIGAVFSVLAAVGMLRFPDVFTRLHAASKAGPLGAGLVLLGVAVASADWSVVVRALVGIALLLVTAPVAAHLLARGALRSGIRPTAGTLEEEIVEQSMDATNRSK